MGPRPLTIASAGVTLVAFVFIIVGIARINSGWFGNSVAVPQAGEVTASFGTRGFCISALGFESCGTYNSIIDMYKKTGGPEEGIDSIKKLAFSGNVTLALCVVAFLLTLFSLFWTGMRGFDAHASFRGWLAAFITLLIGALIALVAAVQFIATVKKIESDNARSGSSSSASNPTQELEVEKLAPHHAWYLVVLSTVFSIVAAILLVVDRKESQYAHMPDAASLNSDTAAYQ